MRRLAALLFLLLAPLAVRAAGWEQVQLFDWVYPGEEAYTALQAAATQAGSSNWLVGRMAQGEKIPQASARELAWQLSLDPKVDAATQARLKSLLGDEPGQLGFADAGSSKDRADKLGAALNDAGKRMDEIERVYKTNNYSKSSTPGLGMDIYTGYQMLNPGGMIQRRSNQYLLGGSNFYWSASIDRINVTLGLGLRYWGGDSNKDPVTSYNRMFDVGASFQVPLDSGGLEVHLGDKVGVFQSPLLFGGIFQEGVEAFAIDFTNAYRPPTVVKVLDLNYPAFTTDIRGVIVKRQGQTWYWPFSNTQFTYAPHPQWYQNWGIDSANKVTTWSLRVDRDINPGRWLDPGLYYALVLNSAMDRDQLAAAGFTSTPYKAVDAYGAGAEFRFVNGSQLKVDGALSNYHRELSAGGPQRLDSDMAYIATLIQPLGPLNLAVQLGMAGPYFLSAPQTPPRTQNGAVLDSMTGTAWVNGDPNGDSWVSYMKDPAVMSNNTSTLSWKAEWHGSWVSLGLYEGAQSQIKATDGRVVINPVIEGRADNGYGWFQMFGQTYTAPNNPTLTPPTPTTGFSDLALQYRFNQPTDDLAAIDPAGGTQKVHWQEISQLSYREVFFTTWLSKDGIGDRHLAAPSVKTFNYMGAHLLVDFSSMFGLSLPSQLAVIGELRDLSLQPGLPSFDASNLYSQNYLQGVWTHSLNTRVTLLGKAAYEVWKSSHSFYPLDMQVTEWGAGVDLNLDPVLTGLKANLRASSMAFDDLSIPTRDFTLWILSVGTTLTY